MGDINFHDMVSIGAGALNTLVVLMSMKLKVDIAELKFWIGENFERKKK